MLTHYVTAMLPNIKTKDGFGHFLKSVARQPMLDKDDETIYGNQVKKMVRLKAIKAGSTIMTDEEWAKLAGISEKELRHTIHVGMKARERFILGNLRLVISVARKYTHRGLDISELTQEGVIGLSKAVDKFDPDKGFKFSTYAMWWIRQMIGHSIQAHSRTIRLPASIYEKLTKIKRGTRYLSQELGQTPRLKDLCDLTKLSTTEIQRLLKLAKHPHSIDIYTNTENGIETIGNMIPSDIEVPEGETQELQEVMYSLLLELEIPEQEVIIHTFGLFQNETLRISLVAKQMGLSIAKTKRYLESGLAKLRTSEIDQVFDYIYANPNSK